MAALVKHKFRSFLNLPRILIDSTEDLERLDAEKKKKDTEKKAGWSEAEPIWPHKTEQEYLREQLISHTKFLLHQGEIKVQSSSFGANRSGLETIRTARTAFHGTSLQCQSPYDSDGSVFDAFDGDSVRTPIINSPVNKVTFFDAAFDNQMTRFLKERYLKESEQPANGGKVVPSTRKEEKEIQVSLQSFVHLFVVQRADQQTVILGDGAGSRLDELS